MELIGESLTLGTGIGEVSLRSDSIVIKGGLAIVDQGDRNLWPMAGRDICLMVLIGEGTRGVQFFNIYPTVCLAEDELLAPTLFEIDVECFEIAAVRPRSCNNSPRGQVFPIFKLYLETLIEAFEPWLPDLRGKHPPRVLKPLHR